MAMANAFFSGKFSSDRTIHEYAKDIWYFFIKSIILIRNINAQ